SIEVETNQMIKSFRLIVPNGTTFHFEDENEQEFLTSFDDGSNLWLLTFAEPATHFSAQLMLEDSGQVSVEDACGEIHSAFLYINTETVSNKSNKSYEEVTPLSSVTVSTWANFRSAWNNASRTEIVVNGSIFSETTSLDTRTSNIRITSNSGGAAIDGRTAPPLSWGPGVTVGIVSVVTLNGFIFQGQGALEVSNGAVVTLRENSIHTINRITIIDWTARVNSGVGMQLNVDNLQVSGYMGINGVIRARVVHLSNSYELVNGGAGTNRLFSETPQSITIDNDLVIYELGNSSSVGNRGWDNLQATVIGGSVTSSSNSTFNDDTFQVNNIWRMRSWNVSTGINPPPSRVQGTVNVNHIDQNEELLLNESFSGDVGSAYTTTANTFEGFELVETPDNATGVFTEEEITVTYVYRKQQGGTVIVDYLDEELNQIAESIELKGFVGDAYETTAIEIEGYTIKEVPENANGIFTAVEQRVIYRYTKDQLDPVSPVDPLEPETEVDPENKPELPEDQGLLSIDFASSFQFGEQSISTQDKTYYAKPQRLLNTDGSINEVEERPNYVQISDRRSERNGWQLDITQQRQFRTQEGHELDGASIQFANQQLATAQEGEEPELLHTDLLTLVPGMKQPLISATSNTGTGTWIYRFGDRESADESVRLEIPSGASPEANSYTTTLIWELSSVPDNN
ncbi:WxL domain-containing protein, partial [Enterococcus innesii]|uniref:WxL domain-containing protein n=1 Tax=Enterococcus innesii TaxID=2839759 RepID=UPI003F842DBD